MDLSWQDSAGSFLDTLGTDPSSSLASYVDGGGAALWSSPYDGASPSGAGSLLWSDRGAPSDDTPALNFATDESISLAPDSTLPATGLLWANSGSYAPVWSDNSRWAADSAYTDGTLSQAASTVSPLWQAVQSNFVDSGGGMAPVFTSALNDVSQVLWTATGGTGQQPLLPLTPDPLLASLGGSSVLTTPSVSSLAPQQLLWSEPQGTPALAGSPTIGAAPATLTNSLGGPVVSSSGPFSMMATQPQATA